MSSITSARVMGAWAKGEDLDGGTLASADGRLTYQGTTWRARGSTLAYHLPGHKWDLLEGGSILSGGWGNTISRYQSWVRGKARQRRILVPGTLLSAALSGRIGGFGLPQHGLDRVRPVEALEDFYTPVVRHFDGPHDHGWRDGERARCEQAGPHDHTEQQHHLGGCLFRLDPINRLEIAERGFLTSERIEELEEMGDRTRYFITGQDDGSFFLSELPRRAKDYRDGLLALMPREVAERTGGVVVQIATETSYKQTGRFEAFGRVPWGVLHGQSGITTRTVTRIRREYPGGVLRQGEWFFLPEDPPARARMVGSKRLDGADSAHFATRAAEYRNHVWVSGVVRHTRDDHPAMYLKGLWYRVIKNCAVRSWSVRRSEGGRVD